MPIRRTIQQVILVLSLSLLVQCVSLSAESPVRPDFFVETISASCQSQPLLSTNVTVEGRTVTITDALMTPNPCYTMEASVEIRGEELHVKFFPKQRKGMCVQCLGEVVGKVTIPDLPTGDYTVTVWNRQRSSKTTIRIE